MDLTVVDKAFGNYADLYSDVLRVVVAATHEQIQLAYFDRRSELFTLLAKMDAKSQDERTAKARRQAERRMDSVVLAVRILGDPDTRAKYDEARQGRLLNRRRAKQAHFDGAHSDSRKSSLKEEPQRSREREQFSRRKEATVEKEGIRRAREERPDDPDETINTQDETDEETDRDNDRSFFSSETDEFRQDDTTVGSGTIGTTTIGDATIDTYTVMSTEDGKEDSSFFCGGSRIVRNITNEISGAFEDTVTSFDQVFNAFTLTDKDIRAVSKRIDKAKRQLDT
jgi:curved DNA-binding protein CbpA